MTNYISRVCVPSEGQDARAVWCESFNEMSHLRDLLLTVRPTQVATQAMRLEWVFASGVRSRPDTSRSCRRAAVAAQGHYIGTLP